MRQTTKNSIDMIRSVKEVSKFTWYRVMGLRGGLLLHLGRGQEKPLSWNLKTEKMSAVQDQGVKVHASQREKQIAVSWVGKNIRWLARAVYPEYRMWDLGARVILDKTEDY